MGYVVVRRSGGKALGREGSPDHRMEQYMGREGRKNTRKILCDCRGQKYDLAHACTHGS